MTTAAWEQIQSILQKVLNPGLFKVWITPLSAEIEQNELRLFAPNEFVAAWVRDRLLEPIGQAATDVLGRRPSVTVAARASRPSVNGNGQARKPSPELESRPGKHLGLPMVTPVKTGGMYRWRFSFDDFVVGPGNKLAHAAAQSICEDVLPHDQLFLSSGPGLGKTHLLQAIGRWLSTRSNRTHPQVAYLTAEEFTTRLIMSIKARNMDQFKALFRDNVDVLLLEDIHFLKAKEKTQDELLSTLKALRARGAKVVLTSTFLPKELSDVDQRLVSRMCSGFMAVISKPDFETRKSIVLAKASTHKAFVPDEVTTLLAERLTTDVRQLESCINNLVLKAKLLNMAITTDLAWQVLSNYDLDNPSPDLAQITEFVCKAFDLSVNQLRSKSRKQQIVLARNTAFYLARKHTELSLKDIGERFNRKHSTVLKGITNVEREISKQTPMGRQIKDAVDRLS